MKIDFVELISKDWNIEHLNGDFIKASCKTIGRGNDPRSFIFPKTIIVDKGFVESVAMYIGDGKLSKDPYHLDFTSKDADVVKFMHDFFKNRFNIKNIFYRISCNKLKNDSVESWANYLDIGANSIRVRESGRFRYECFNFQIGGRLFVEVFKNIVEEVLKYDFINDPILRRAFLRGLFAAEGSVNINKLENYLVYMGYHFSYGKEKKLAEFVKKLLKLEGIDCKLIIRQNKGERYLQITNWNNYARCWQIGLFDLCKRKKETFLWKLNKIKTSHHINDDLKAAIAL